MKSYRREIKAILTKSRLNNLTTDELTDALVLLVDEVLAGHELFILQLQSKLNPIQDSWVEELYEAYPQHLSDEIAGKKAVAKGLSGYTMDQLNTIYLKAIKNEEKRHAQIKSLIEWGIKNKMIRFGFAQFILGKDFERLEIESLKHSQSLKTVKYGEREL
jgi:hypothetical protein